MSERNAYGCLCGGCPDCLRAQGYDPDAPELSEQEAVDAVVACLDGRAARAYGETADWWCEVLLDHICEPADFRTAALMVLGRAEGMSAARHLCQGLEHHIHDTALGLQERVC